MKKILLLILVIIIAAVSYAGDVARKGTTGAEELLIPVGARGIATGGSFLATLSGIESIYYNPAGLDLTHGTEAMFSYMNYIADINMSYFAVSTSLGEIGSIGLSFKTFDFGDIPVTTTQFPDGTGESYSPTFLIAGLTYSKVITDRITVGTNFKLISETIQNTSANGFAVDVGVQYRFNNQLSLGATVKNIGSNMSFDGPNLQNQTIVPGTDPNLQSAAYQVVTEDFQIPSYFDLSVAYKYDINNENHFQVAGTFVANNSLEDYMNFGAEYSFMNIFFVRGGYNLLLGENTSDNSIFGFTTGAGLDYKVGEGLNVTFDYAFREVKEFPTPNHIFTVKLGLQ